MREQVDRCKMPTVIMDIGDQTQCLLVDTLTTTFTSSLTHIHTYVYIYPRKKKKKILL